MALLCAYLLNKAEGESLEAYLENRVFADAPSVTLTATEEETAGFRRFLESYGRTFPVEEMAAQIF